MRYGGVEKRCRPRHVCDTTLEFRLCLSPARTYIGAGVNISDTGMCIYTFEPFKEGDEIEIVKKIPIPHRKAVVCWVKECCEDFYKIGITFVKPSDAS